MSMRRYLAMILVLIVGAARGPVPARAQDEGPAGPEPQAMTPQKNNLASSNAPYWFTSREGCFRVYMPGGCPKVRARTQGEADLQSDPGEKEPWVLIATCDRYGQQGIGCMISAYLGVKGEEQAPAGPERIVKIVEEYLQGFGVEILGQQVVQRTFPDGLYVEGVDIRAAEPDGAGQVWIRGLACEIGGYVLAAWNDQGGVFEDPDFQEFFDSFTPEVPE